MGFFFPLSSIFKIFIIKHDSQLKNHNRLVRLYHSFLCTDLLFLPTSLRLKAKALPVSFQALCDLSPDKSHMLPATGLFMLRLLLAQTRHLLSSEPVSWLPLCLQSTLFPPDLCYTVTSSWDNSMEVTSFPKPWSLDCLLSSSTPCCYHF